ncbi:MAG: response regulator [Pseudomonadales bacterium]|nr:response regulator [Pseudomonadales bacterium]
MSPDSLVPLLSLSFMWLFTVVFLLAVYLCYRETRYTYLRPGFFALALELARLTVNNLILGWQVAPLYYLSSCLLFAESACVVQMVAGAAGYTITKRNALTATAVFLLILAINPLLFDPAKTWTWYITYAPSLAAQAFTVYFAIRLNGRQSPTPGWLLAAALATLATRFALPALSVQVSATFGLVYFLDGIMFTLMVGSMTLVAMKQLASDKAAALDEQQRAEAMLRFVLDNAEDVVLSHNASGIVTSWNDRARGMFGYDADEAIGKLVVDQILLFVSEDESGGRKSYVAYANDGRRTPVEVSRRHAMLGANIGYTLVIRSVGAQREIERQRQQLSYQQRQIQKLESLGVFAAGIAHDFNNLLSGISGQVELAIRNLDDAAEARGALDQVLTATERAAELTGQMLTYAGRSDFRPVLMDLNESVQQITTLMRASVHQQATIDLSLMPGGAWIQGDRTQVTQVLINLITNAADALGGKSGTITIATSRAAQNVLLTVSDTGHGMAPEVKERVFEPFFSTKSTGRGLGLAAVSSIAASHRANVDVTSAPGKGTEFTFAFPMATARDRARTPGNTSEAQEPGEQSTGQALSVLVVEDQLDLQELCARILGSAGHEAISALSGEQAVTLLNQRKVDLIVMDCGLPGRSGTDIYRDLVASGMRIPAIFISGFNLARIRDAVDPSWPATMLKKPFTADELLEAVNLVSDPGTPGKATARR